MKHAEYLIYDLIICLSGVKVSRPRPGLVSRRPVPRRTCTQEWIIVGGVPGESRNRYPVSRPGDSGALLVNDDQKVVAMIIGGVREHVESTSGDILDNITVITPVSRLLGWIQEGLGLDMDFGGH